MHKTWTGIGALLLAAGSFLTPSHVTAEVFVPCDKLQLVGATVPADAEMVAARIFAQRVQRLSGVGIPLFWGEELAGERAPLRVGNGKTLDAFLATMQIQAPDTVDADARAQSYVVAPTPEGGVIAAGFGESFEPRSFLGLGYALGDLLRRLEQRDGIWGFLLSDEPIIGSPAMPNRTLYLMNSDHMNPGLSLEYAEESVLETYVDFLIEARYSRISFWQWTANMLYPGNFEDRRTRNEMTHRAMRHLLEYARRRGLQVFHQVTPMHANVDLLPDDPRFVSTGYYGRSSICWAQPEGRALARNMLRLEMEYFGPVDGYIVWYYDPGGCFCDVCLPNQAQHLFEQFSLVRELAGTISPGAEFQTSLWPTWCFHEYRDRGVPYESAQQVNAFLADLLGKLSTGFRPRELTILDTGEMDNSNIYNGVVDPVVFKRSAFMYSVMGLPSESMYPFAPFKTAELVTTMGRARDRGIEDANFFIQYALVNKPSVFAFADALYDPEASAAGVLGHFAASMATGEARALLYTVLDRLEALQLAATYDGKRAALAEAEAAWEKLSEHPEYAGSRDWLSGFLVAQKRYLGMATSDTEEQFLANLATLKDELGRIPMWEHYAAHVIEPDLIRSQIKTFWPSGMAPEN